MEKAHQVVTAETARQFLEQTLGFGEPIDGGSIQSLFGDNSKVFYYGSRKDGIQASLNAVTRVVWDNKHMTETGRVFADIFSSPVGRVSEFIERELASKGLKPIDMIDSNQGQKLKQMIRLLKEFNASYLENVDPYTDLQTSLSLRPRENEYGKYDLVLRAGLFSKYETMYFEYTFSNIVKGIIYLIHDVQLSVTVSAVRAYLESFGKKSKLFREITGFEISKLITHQVLLFRHIAEDALYSLYYQMIQGNKGFFKERRDIVQAEEVVEWDALSEIHWKILENALEIARTHIDGFIDFNKMEAQEAMPEM